MREVEEVGGAALGAHHEPLTERPILLAVLPREAVEPTPFQRDLSPTHAKRLAQKIDEAGAFLDPIIVARGAAGGFWTPNGRRQAGPHERLLGESLRLLALHALGFLHQGFGLLERPERVGLGAARPRVANRAEAISLLAEIFERVAHPPSTADATASIRPA